MSAAHEPSPPDFGLMWTLMGRLLKARSFIVTLVLGAGITAIMAFTSRPVYRSEAALLYEDRNAANPVALQRADGASPRRIGLTLQEMLFARALLEKLIRELALYPKTVARYGIVAAVEQMQKWDLHFTTREGYTFRVGYDSTSPEEAQLVAARATELLIQAHLAARVDEVKEVERFLDAEKRRVEEELRAHESELALFVAKHPDVLEMGSVRNEILALDGSADTASLGLEMQALQLRDRLAQLRQQRSAAPAARAAVPPELSEARVRAEAELAVAQRELAEKRAQFTDEYPDVKRARGRVESAKAQLRHVEESAAAVLARATAQAAPPAGPGAVDQGEARLVQQQIELVEKQMRAVRSHAQRPQLRSARTADPDVRGRHRAQYIELERQARESREHLALLEDRQFQAEMQALFATQARRADLVVVDPAFKPVVALRSPRPKVIGVGSALSLFGAVAIGLLFVLRDDRLRHTADLRRFRLPRLLCEVPPP